MAEVSSSQASPQVTSSVREVHISTDRWLTHLPVIAKCNIFNGHNLILWERTIQAALKPRKLIHHLTEDGPVDTHPNFQKWVMEEEFVFAWLLDSIAPEQMSRFTRYDTSRKLWEAIGRSHSKRGNKAKIIDLIIKSYTFKQGDKDILEYSNELRDIHTELDHCYPQSTDQVARARESTNRLCQLLQGLRPEFENVRSQLYNREEEPTFDESITKLMQEESRLQSLKGAIEGNAYFTKGQKNSGQNQNQNLRRNETERINKEDLVCNYCKKTGHTKDKCWKLHGKPPHIAKAHLAQNSQQGGSSNQGTEGIPSAQDFQKMMQELQSLKTIINSSGSIIGSTSMANTGDGEALKVTQSDGTNNGSTTENSGLRDVRNIFKLHTQREKSRERKAKWTLKNSHNVRLSRLIKKSAEVLGTENTLEVLGKLGKETGVKEYNALIGLCIEKVRESTDESDSLIHLQKAFQLFRSMKEKGFQIEEESYGPLLTCLIDMRLILEFHTFIEIINDESCLRNPRISYYEMLLWIKAGNEEKIREGCYSVIANGSVCDMSIAENYLLAFCVGDRKEEMLQLLNILDVRRISSLEYLSVVFLTLGKLSLENLAMESFLALKSGDVAENISLLIFDYISKLSNLSVVEVVSKFIEFHSKLEMEPSGRSLEKLIAYCCNLFKVCTTLDPLGRGREQICRLDWVRELCSVAWKHSLRLDKESFRSMMSLYTMTKDFEGAHDLLAELKEMNMELDTSLYNAVMIGCFKEKNIYGGFKVLKEMKNGDVKPDSETFSYLIFNCGCEEDIIKCLEEMKHFQVDYTKHTYIALINAYANCGKFDLAKQVIADKWVPVEHINEIKSALITALSSKGRISDALEIYDAMKESGCWVEPKAIVSIIEFYRFRGHIKRLVQLLADLENSSFWFDACGRVVLYCIRNNLLSSAIDLLKQLKTKDETGACSVIDQVFCQIWESEPTNMKMGMELLCTIKEELGLLPSRASLDFLLSACVKVKDLKSARSIWAEYSKAGLPFNVLSYLRMYHALMAGGDFAAAEKISKIIPRDDKHVWSIINACKATYMRIDDLMP